MPYTNISSREPFSLAPTSLFFITCQADCPLNIYDRLVWSWLLRFRHAEMRINISAVSEIVGIKRNTLYAALHRLYAGVDTQWFVTRPATNWYDGFAYFVVEFDHDLSLVQNVLLGLLRSLKKMRRLGDQSYLGLGTLIGCERRTIRRALAGLADRVEVIQSTRKCYRNTDRFDIILKEPADTPAEPAVNEPKERPLIGPVEQPVERLAESVPHDKANLPGRQCTIGERIPGFNSMDDTGKMHAIMKLYDYPHFDRNRIVELTEKTSFPFPVVSLAQLVTECNEYHNKSGRKGNAAKLVIYKLEVLLGIRLRTKVTSKSKPRPDWRASAEQEIRDELVDIRIELEHMGATKALSDRVLHCLSTDWTRGDYFKALKEVGKDVNNLWALVGKA